MRLDLVRLDKVGTDVKTKEDLNFKKLTLRLLKGDAALYMALHLVYKHQPTSGHLHGNVGFTINTFSDLTEKINK